MAAEVLYSWGPGENRLALVRDGRLADLVVVRSESLTGAVLMGRVVEVAPKLGAVFVDIGQDQPGFVAAKGITKGQALLVQVKADAQGGKGCALTLEPSLSGRCLVFTPGRTGVSVPRKLADDKRERLLSCLTPLVGDDEGVVVRAHAASAPEAELEAELAHLRQQWAAIAAAAAGAGVPSILWRPEPLQRLLSDNPGVSRVVVDDPELLAAARSCFAGPVEMHRDGPLFALHDVDDAIAAACDPVVSLPCGGRVTIEQTAALTAIDVDSGGASGIEANTQAVAVVARQLRLRNIAGQVVVDFVSGGGKGALFKLVASLKQAVARDPVATHVIGVTPLGLVEITRERKGPSLADLMAERVVQPRAEAVALAALRQVLAESRHRPGKALALVVSPEIAAVLDRRRDAVIAVESRLGRRLAVRSETARRYDDVAIEEAS